MDSPLLPQLDRHPDVSLLDDPSMLEDMTIDSEANASTYNTQTQAKVHRRPSQDQHLFTRDNHDRASASDNASAGGRTTRAAPRMSVFGPPGGVGAQRRGLINIDSQLDDAGDLTDRYKSARTTATAGAKPRFSLFAPPRPPSAEPEADVQAQVRDHDQEQDNDDNEQQHDHEANENNRGSSTAAREARDDKLRESLYELRRMNEVFDGFLGALEGVRGHNERLAQRVQQTSALLDEYTAIMGQTEFTQRLLLNPKWTGSADDAEAIAAEEEARFLAQQAAEEEARRQVEAARLAEEERERRAAAAALGTQMRNEKGTRTGAGAGALGRGGAGVGAGRPRGRGGFGAGAGTGARGGTTARGRGTSTGIPRPSMMPRPTSGAGSGTTTTRKVTPTSASNRGTSNNGSGGGGGGGNGLGGQYSHVKSSGYGPR
ncbi:hypothetical protein I316_04238 [Kwoniella heveanensis BCC8398]|uniref:DASH complex subunit DUO1 n=1 Tax=Kwoniella heveanensis BCC8398 TaxID=1296120 RepID=A0A1B9GS99_9TREE|nr:hypothetical protein I316_04238 [Kwoniella heveanensis BCC8398]